jgi:cephalosporin-C deacetylase-like acetyl esterase
MPNTQENLRPLLVAVALLVALPFVSRPISAQERAERSIEEIKVEAVKRAQTGMYPMIGLDPADVEEAFASVKTRDKDEWAAAFMHVADRYMAEGKAVAQSNPTKANADFVRAWRVYSFGRWPIPSSPKKKESYAKAIEAFLAHAKFWDPPLEVVHIPFEGAEIIGYLRLPKNATGLVPVVIAVNGLDSRKEDLTESFGAILPYGIGFLAVDGPGTGQCPIKASPTADRLLSRVIDYLQARPEVDKTRIAFHGVSWGAYWGTKMSVVEHDRLKAVSVQSPPTDTFFTRKFLTESLLGNREYLFDQVPALMAIFDNVNSVDDIAAVFEKMSLAKQGILGKPTTPMLVIAGVKDTQVPISDIYELMNSGDIPKEAWINPSGGHLGRQVKVWPDPLIFRRILLPWIARNLDVPPLPESEKRAGD